MFLRGLYGVCPSFPQTKFAAECNLGFAYQRQRLGQRVGRGFRLTLKPGLDFGPRGRVCEFSVPFQIKFPVTHASDLLFTLVLWSNEFSFRQRNEGRTDDSSSKVTPRQNPGAFYRW